MHNISNSIPNFITMVVVLSIHDIFEKA